MMADLTYAGGELDRAAARRSHADWLAARRADGEKRVLPVWRDLNLVSGDRRPTGVALFGRAADTAIDDASEIAFLGIDADHRAWFAADLSLDDEGGRERWQNGARFAELRSVGPLMRREEGALLAYARGLLYWHRRHRFCGGCGHATESRDGGHLRVCGDAACGAETFPRTDPAVIMLITRNDGEEALLARQSRWPAGMMSTLAGFVEPGESLEEAVAREVLEEAGIVVPLANIRYLGSQPWPFPSSLMLGFRGEAAADCELAIDPEEIEDARWFTRDDIVHKRIAGIKLPRRDSIARRLINDWLEENG